MPYKDTDEQRNSQRLYYLKNKAKYVSSVKKRRIERAKWWASYKEEMHFKCIICGEDHPACVSFHHTNPEEKVMGVSDLVGLAYPVDVILAEIEKCDVLCHNCHAKYHWHNDLRRRNSGFGGVWPSPPVLETGDYVGSNPTTPTDFVGQLA